VSDFTKYDAARLGQILLHAISETHHLETLVAINAKIHNELIDRSVKRMHKIEDKFDALLDSWQIKL
jgi:hypothetical protein